MVTHNDIQFSPAGWVSTAEGQCGMLAQAEAGLWGHEYVRSLSGEIGEEYHARREAEELVEDLLELVSQIVPYHMSHNAGGQSSLMQQHNKKLTA